MLDDKIHSDLKIAIPKISLENGAYYGGRCRNAYIARWDETRGVFVHWRTKFTSFFTETIQHPEDGLENRFDYFLPLYRIDAPVVPIPIEEDREPVDAAFKQAYAEWEEEVRKTVRERV